jgi:hypothetical protein
LITPSPPVGILVDKVVVVLLERGGIISPFVVSLSNHEHF